MGAKRQHDTELEVVYPDGAKRQRGTFSSVDVDTAAYFSEVRATLATLETEEERELLANGALAESSGMETEIAGDGICSRVLEALLPIAGADAVMAFAAPLTKPDAFLKLATRCSSPSAPTVCK